MPRMLRRAVGACCLPAGPLIEELLAGVVSLDANVRAAAKNAVDGLKAFGAWRRRCHCCGRVEEEEGRFSLCGGCRQRVFCGRDCQVAAWGAGHKAECKALAPR